ncbi:hypothetical protein BDZ94DRAFT_1312139 [Collybia nuda]|uniref:F-box domain-containing protein n=1 Tax=Collybia nuda TaxID=64659 RepID=A0A9P5Y016_9AGAR|nr:hypothetical protein BDZ94DRAFT_1312139 [Collybia nuda]
MKFNDSKALPRHITDRLAAEFYDRILDHIHYSKSTLSACSLVCKSWFSTTRYHLFFEANLTPNLVRLIQSSDHAMETVAPHIRNVGLGGAWMKEKQHSFNHVMLFLLRLDNVQGLYIETWNWDVLNSATSNMLIRAQGTFFWKINQLHLKYARFPSFSIFTRFIQAFPLIEDLLLDNVTWDHIEYPFSALPPPTFADTGGTWEQNKRLSHLTKLHIRSCLIDPILNWLIDQAQSIPPIRILSLPEIQSSEIKQVAVALRTLGPFLEHVDLGFMTYSPWGSPLQDPSDLVDLSFNSNLQNIHIRQLTLYQFPDDIPGILQGSPTWTQFHASSSNITSQFSWVSTLLSTISSSQVLKLTFTVWLGTEHQLDLLNWTAISDVLNKPPFSSLKTFRIEILGMGRGREQVRGWLLARLGCWAPAEATLQVAFTDE